MSDDSFCSLRPSTDGAKAPDRLYRHKPRLFTPVVREANPVSLYPSVAQRPFIQLIWWLGFHPDV